jgi:hypothetical protein
MGNSINYRGNVGWTLWNFSKRISAVMWEAREAGKILNTCRSSGRWSRKDLAKLERLAELLDNCAARAKSTWKALQAAVNETDPALIEQFDGIAVIRGGGSRPDLYERIRVIYGADTSDAESQELAQQVHRLVTSVDKA